MGITTEPNQRPTNEHLHDSTTAMRLLVFSILAAVSTAAPQYGYTAPPTAPPPPPPDSVESSEEIPAYAYSAPRSVESDESYEIIPILSLVTLMATSRGLSHSPTPMVPHSK